MSVRISLTLEASEMFLSLHMVFTLERAAVVWTILERISGFDLGNTIPPEIKRSLTIDRLLINYSVGCNLRVLDNNSVKYMFTFITISY